MSLQASHGLYGLDLCLCSITIHTGLDLCPFTLPSVCLYKKILFFLQSLPIKLRNALVLFARATLCVEAPNKVLNYLLPLHQRRFCRRGRTEKKKVGWKLFTERKKSVRTVLLLATAPPFDFHVQFHNSPIFLFIFKIFEHICYLCSGQTGITCQAIN